MFRILGPGKSLTDRISRRELLRAGGLGTLGLTSVGALAHPTPVSGAGPVIDVSRGFGKAKQCILLFIYGAWSQLDTFDPKPQAPEQIRGEFGSITTRTPDLRICEHLPLTAQVIDRCCVVRNMSHPNPIHNSAYTLTGNEFTVALEGKQRHPDHWPYFGSVLEFLSEREEAVRGEFVPANVGFPWVQSSRSKPNKRAGLFGGFLGSSYDPLWAEFEGTSPEDDPFRSITRDGKFSFNQKDVAGITLDILDRRRSLLEQLEDQTTWIDDTLPGKSYERNRRRAFQMHASRRMKDALRIDDESAALRERYGMTLFGQATLCARRLIERGVRLVTVNWDEFARSDESWDTHFDHHPRMKGFLLPGFDKAYSALLTDLEERGLLDETLVLCLSEHGRTPKFFEISKGVGRDHWSLAYSQIFAGAGIRRGAVVGGTDAIAAYPTEEPISPKDVLCTAYHLLGIDQHTRIPDQQGRLWPLVSHGRVLTELLS